MVALIFEKQSIHILSYIYLNGLVEYRVKSSYKNDGCVNCSLTHLPIPLPVIPRRKPGIGAETVLLLATAVGPFLYLLLVFENLPDADS
jgi:hypothetical protein